MHVTCVICSDLFTPTSDIYSTPCGHIFHYTCLLHWLENSKTCPQCRSKVSAKSLIRLYVNVASAQGSEADITVMQYKLDSVEFKISLKDKEIRNLALKNQQTQEQNKGLRNRVLELEVAEKKYESIIAAQKDQIKYFKRQAQECDKLQGEVTKLKNDMKNLEYVQVVVNGSRQQVDDIVRNENNVESLALLVAILKKSLVEADGRKRELQSELRKTRHEFSQCKRKMTEMKCEYEDTKRQLESLKLNYEKEVAFLKNKFSQIQAKVTKGCINDSLNNSIRRITSESPVNYNRTPILSGNKGDFIDLCDTPETPPCSATSQPKSDTKGGIIIEDSPLPASSMGLFGIQKTKMLGNNADLSKFSIFKNKPVTSEPYPVRTKDLEITYDGLGGSSKEDIYPTPSGTKRPKTSKMTSNKFKKLSADAGKTNRKVSEFLTIN